MGIDLLPEDLYDLHAPVKWKDRISYDDLRLSQQVPIVVSYDLVDLEKTPYHFHQNFTLKDTQTYFSLMKRISGSTVNDLLDSEKNLHFYRTDVRGNLKSLLHKISPQAVEANPLIFHFALYTDEGAIADRSKDIRAPRIYFMLGRNGIVYMLFFDPYHEINPMVTSSASCNRG